MMDGHSTVPDDIPVVNAVEFAAEMTKSWKVQTDRIVFVIVLVAIIGTGVLTAIQWGVQWRISRAGMILDSTRQSVAQNRDMIDSLREDRITSEQRFRALMAAVKSVEYTIEQRRGRK